MSNILWLKDISKNSIPKVGGKGANLGEMFNANLPIPNAFVVTADTYKLFLERTGIQHEINQALKILNIEDTKQLKETAEKIQNIILSVPIPQDIKKDIIKSYSNLNINHDLINQAPSALQFIKAGRDNPFVAVRSSATAEDLPSASFAGQQETYLNIKGPEQVLQAVHQCWASLYTARAIYYREKNNFEHSKVYIAVVIQKMINSSKAGVMFTINPTTNEKEILIEATYGLGDAVVSGSISPDQYKINKEELKIKNITVNKKEWMLYRDSNTGRTTKRILPDEKANSQVLTEEEIKKLSYIALQIEDHYKSPQDIEFAIEDNNIYIVQTRPITTIKQIEKKVETTSEESKEIKEENLILSGISASPGIGSGTVKIVHGLEDLQKIQEGDVLVAKMTNPDYVPSMKKASAIVTDEGGSSCHAAIVSREMGIPAIVGTKEATQKLHEGQQITVNGAEGKVYKGFTKVEQKIEIRAPEHIPETKTKIKVNLDMPDLVEKAKLLKPDGIGLLRIEFIIAQNKIHPSKFIKENKDEEYTNLLEKDIEKIAINFENKPIWIRTSDIRSDEYRELDGGENEPNESNPMMGMHGIRKGLKEPRLLKAELKAIKNLREGGHKNLAIMLPMVSHLDQIIKTKEILKELNMEDVDLGVMIETPAACFIIHEICKDEQIKFLSIGSNDLTQFTLAVDRNNAEVQDLYNAMNPAVLRMIKKVVKTAQKYKVQSSICGQAGSNEDMAKYLTEIGIDSISVNLDAVNKIRELVAKIEKEKGL